MLAHEPKGWSVKACFDWQGFPERSRRAHRERLNLTALAFAPVCDRRSKQALMLHL